VRIAAQLYRRFDALIHEVSKFGVVGAVGFVLNYAITNLLHVGLHWGPLTANVIATVVTVTYAYFANRFWTFRHREQSGLTREYFLFFVFNGVGLLIQILCIGFTFYTLKLSGPLAYNASLTVGVVGGTLFRYWSYKKWVFLPPSLPPVDPHTGLPEPPPPRPAQAPVSGEGGNGVRPANGRQGQPANGRTGRPAGHNGASGQGGEKRGAPDRAPSGGGTNGVRPTTRAR
jgi:putative flippase GtrA